MPRPHISPQTISLFLLVALLAAPARAQDDANADAAMTPPAQAEAAQDATPADAASFPSPTPALAVDALMPKKEDAPAMEPAESIAKKSACSVRAVVLEVKMVRPATNTTYNAPSMLDKIETHVTVSLQQRAALHPEDAAAADATPRCELAKAESRKATYKLCAPVALRAGDMIQATEGTETGPSKALGCLFDVSVLSRPTTDTPVKK